MQDNHKQNYSFYIIHHIFYLIYIFLAFILSNLMVFHLHNYFHNTLKNHIQHFNIINSLLNNLRID